MNVRRTWPAIAGFQVRGKDHGPKNMGSLRSWKKQRKGSFSEPVEADADLLTPWF